MSFISELKRRNVIRMAGLYLVAAWLITQVAATLLPVFEAPSWVMKTLVVILVLGFIPALIFAWVFELTPDGLKREHEVDRSRSIVDQTARRLDIAVIVLLLIVVGLTVWGSGKRPANEVTAVDSAQPASPISSKDEAVAVQTKSVAVLPFDNLSSDPEQGYFADGLTEEILNALAAVPDLMVTARTSSFYFKDKDVPVDEIGKRLGVEHILEGSVRRSGDQLRVTAQLVRAHDGFHLWSHTYDRPFKDAFAVQDDIAQQVATVLGILLNDAVRERMSTSGVRDPEAYALYFRGFELFIAAHNGKPQIPTLMEANRFYDQSVAAAPNLWAAYYESADLYSHILLSLAAGTDPNSLPATEVAEAASQLRARLNAAARATSNEAARDFIEVTNRFFSTDWSGLSALLRRAYQRTEACGFDQWMQLGAVFGLYDEARALFHRGMKCNRLDDSNWIQTAYLEMFAGKPQAAIEVLDRALAVPEFLQSRSRFGSTKVMALIVAGRLEDARFEAKRNDLGRQQALLAEVWLAAVNADKPQLDRLLAQAKANANLGALGYLGALELDIAARTGNREEANRIAAEIDARPNGPMMLAVRAYWCLCGAPFDLSVTPNFAARLKESGLAWPPTSPVNWPLKNW